MYIATIYNEEYGDIDATQPAESFDDAVGYVLGIIGRAADYQVQASRCGKLFRLTVMRGETTLATVCDEPPAPRQTSAEVVSACNDLARGDAQAIQNLFRPEAAAKAV